MSVWTVCSLSTDSFRVVAGVLGGAVNPDVVLPAGAQEVVKVAFVLDLPPFLHEFLDHGIDRGIIMVSTSGQEAPSVK